jgi:ubiquinone biosynthesis protein
MHTNACFHQDALPTRPFSTIKATVERELKAPLGELFSWVDETPLATASIAQVDILFID